MNFTFDQCDQELLSQILVSRDKIKAPRLGDYVLFTSGQLERFSHNWNVAIQTTPEGSFFLHSSGHCEFSGGLNPEIPTRGLELTEATLPGLFWFFHHGRVQAGGRVYFEIPCRVYKTEAPYCGYLGRDFQMEPGRLLRLQNMLGDQGLFNAAPDGSTHELYVKIAADSIAALRKVDVYRVIESVHANNSDGISRASLARWISDQRPDLAQEAAEVLAELTD
jgi:hypothetical protein